MLQKNCDYCKEELFDGENFFRHINTLDCVCMSCFDNDIKKFKGMVFPATRTMNKYWEKYVEKHGMKV